MSRLLARIVAWGLLVPLFALLFMPLTEKGTRLILDNAGRVLPIEIEYAGGALAGELQLERLAWGDADRSVGAKWPRARALAGLSVAQPDLLPATLCEATGDNGVARR